MAKRTESGRGAGRRVAAPAPRGRRSGPSRPEACAAPTKGGIRFLGLYFIWRLGNAPAHGYALIEEMAQSPLLAGIRTSTIYAILSLLEERGYIRSHSRAQGGRMRKVYVATARGLGLVERMRGRSIRGPMREFVLQLLG